MEINNLIIIMVVLNILIMILQNSDKTIFEKIQFFAKKSIFWQKSHFFEFSKIFRKVLKNFRITLKFFFTSQ